MLGQVNRTQEPLVSGAIRGANPLERGNREIGRRSDVVGSYPNDAAPLRLAGMLPLEQDDELAGWPPPRRPPQLTAS
jgi:putative transposase